MQALMPAHCHEIAIRVGEDADTEFFLEVEEQTTWENLPPDQAHINRDELRAKLRGAHEALISQTGHIYFVAHVPESGEKMGLVWFGPRFNSITCENEGWIYNLTVMPEHRGCGVAKRLLLHAEQHARDAGFDVIGLSVAAHNDVARSLYERMEFSVSNVLMRKVLRPASSTKV